MKKDLQSYRTWNYTGTIAGTVLGEWRKDMYGSANRTVFGREVARGNIVVVQLMAEGKVLSLAEVMITCQGTIVLSRGVCG